MLAELTLLEEGWEDYGRPFSERRTKLATQVAERAGIGEAWSSARGTREQSRGTIQDVREDKRKTEEVYAYTHLGSGEGTEGGDLDI